MGRLRQLTEPSFLAREFLQTRALFTQTAIDPGEKLKALPDGEFPLCATSILESTHHRDKAI